MSHRLRGIPGWRSDPDAHGVDLTVCNRAFTVGRGPNARTVHLTRADRLDLASYVLAEVSAEVTGPVRVRPSGRWLVVAALTGANAATVAGLLALLVGR